jgi:hypothetical protein
MEVTEMPVQVVDPAEFPGWDERLLRSGDQAFFHSSAWCRVLRATYGYKPTYLVRDEKERFSLLLPMMEVSALLMGKRGVSLPFTDRCAAHASESASPAEAVEESVRLGRARGWRTIEWRDGASGPPGSPAWRTYLTHEVELGRPEAALFDGMSPSSRRNVRKALRERLSVRIDDSAESVRSFYHLNCVTRKRHGLPPQPFVFFKNVHRFILSQGSGIVVSASYAGRMVAAAVFFHFGNAAVFKYGASEADRRRLRPNNLVMWEALKWYNDRGFSRLNLGRTGPEDIGLLRYKRNWGGVETLLRYYKFDLSKDVFLEGKTASPTLVNRLFSLTPIGISRLLSRLFYGRFG